MHAQILKRMMGEIFSMQLLKDKTSDLSYWFPLYSRGGVSPVFENTKHIRYEKGSAKQWVGCYNGGTCQAV